MSATSFPKAPLFRLAPALLVALALAGCADDNSSFGPEPSRPLTASQRMGELQVALRRNPNDVETLKEYGKIQADLGQWSQSMGAYREALLVKPDDRDAVMGYGRAQLAVGDYAGALSMAQKAGGSDLPVLLLKSGALTGLNRLAEARAVLDAATRMHPRDLDVRSNIAIIAGLTGDPQAYGIARAAAFAPDSSYSHRRNLILVGGMTRQDATARADGQQLGLAREEIGDILAVGHRARTQGMRAFGIMPAI